MDILNEFDYLESFIHNEHLPIRYIDIAKQWFIPVINELAEQVKQVNKPIVIGVNGCQGSGKSTISKLMVNSLEKTHQIKAIAISIDDFYYTKSERKQLSNSIHPLLITRGVPGSHDLNLAIATITSLQQHKPQCLIPTFNKATDDRNPQSEWVKAASQVDIIIIEGWCVGSESEKNKTQLSTPINTLESEEDTTGAWRTYINRQLQTEYPKLFSLIDYWVMLKAPSFDCVYEWRLEQENKLRDKLTAIPNADLSGVMDEVAIRRFIQHYQRITEHTLKYLPKKVHFLFELDKQRNIQSLTKPIKL